MAISVAAYFDYLGIWSGFEQFNAYNNKIQKKGFFFQAQPQNAVFGNVRLRK